MLAHQGLLPSRRLEGNTGVLDLFTRLGCIQFDPINIVGRNPDLVLHARVKDYQPQLLEELLYRDHRLIEGFDKVGSIYRAVDWPYFSRFRERVRGRHWNRDAPEITLAHQLLQEMKANGRDSRHQKKSTESIVWDWGRPVKMERAAWEILNSIGEVTISGRENNRKTYDLVERVIPARIRNKKDPNRTLEQYHDWHVLRRTGGLGLVQAGQSEFWLGIHGMKTPERRQAIERLVARSELLAVEIDGLSGAVFFMRALDRKTLEKGSGPIETQPEASFLPPLDNLLWDRKLLKWIFDFEYLWEIYKKPHLRQYGHYTLPVLYGDSFIARFNPVFERKTGILRIDNWWWEEKINPGRDMQAALRSAVMDFARYLNTASIQPSIEVARATGMRWLKGI
jgi:uncharacterized protein YcaQ